MPTYNRKEIIGRSIYSVLAQTYSNWELIICDDGSNDGTYKYIKEITKDNRIKYLLLSHRGVSKARNTGLDACTGEYIAYLDTDNTWHHNFLFLMILYMHIGNLDAAYCQIACLDEKSKTKGYRGDIFSWYGCLEENYIDMNSFIHKRNQNDGMIHRNILPRFDENLNRLVDWDYILNWTKDAAVSFCPLPLVNYYHGNDFQRISRTIHNNEESLQERTRYIQEKHYNYDEKDNFDKLTFQSLLNSLQKKLSNKQLNNTKLYFYPDYTSTNSYQKLFYEPMTSTVDIKSCAIDKVIKDEIAELRDISGQRTPSVFHLHWHEIFFNGIKERTKIIEYTRLAIININVLKSLGFKIIWTLHNSISHDCQFISEEIVFINKIIELSDKIVIHDIDVIDIVKPWYEIPIDKIIICKHAKYEVPIELIKKKGTISNLIRKRYSIPNNGIIFGVIGQIREYKNIKSIIEAFLRISASNDNLFLLIAGNPVKYNVEFLEKSAKNNNNIMIDLRFIPEQELIEIMQDIDCMILNYKNILTSGSYHLAETLGCPIITPELGLLKGNHKIVMQYSFAEL